MNRRQRKTAKRLANGHAKASLFEQLTALGACPEYGDDCHTVEAAAIVARARVTWQAQRAAILAQHRKRSQIVDAEMLQELHSPTVQLAVDDPEDMRRLRRNLTRVRQSEAWRHNALSPMQRQAETEMHLAWQLRTTGLGMSAGNLARIGDGQLFGHANSDHGEAERYAAIDETWREFVRQTQRQQIWVGLAIRVLAESKTLAEIEHDFRLRAGTALPEYLRALDLWCVLRGWARSAPL